MRIPLPCLIFMAACSNEANHIGNPLLLPFSGLATVFENSVYNERRGRVEVFVKSNHPALIADITAGGGGHISEAMNIARIPASDQPTRLIQMKSDIALYKTNPGALVTALMVYRG